MGYAAARGGLEAIEAAEALVRRKRLVADSDWLNTDQLVERQRLAVDRVMGEGGLWAPEIAARALRQAEGDVIEAAHLVRSYRSTLPRLATTEVVSMDRLSVLRRIVPAYRNPPGPQLLGRTLDYTGRLLDLTPDAEARAEALITSGTPPVRTEAPPVRTEDDVAPNDVVADDFAPSDAAPDDAAADGVAADGDGGPDPAERRPQRLLDLLRKLDLVVDRRRADDPEPADITRNPVRPGAPRSARLAVMARAETGALVNLWYRNILGPDNHIHEVTLGEVRHGRIPVPVTHPFTGNPVRVGSVRVTEVEAIEDLDGPDEDRTRFDVGYGLCLGHNERKAIAMANLDISVERDRGRSALEQSVLQTTDGLDSSGFLEHLKLPHYVTFRSMVERKHAMRAASGSDVVPEEREVTCR
jgi:alpha-D-ribose 1-methylphosphonate 5-triphosphate synthase subunit PhnI